MKFKYILLILLLFSLACQDKPKGIRLELEEYVSNAVLPEDFKMEKHFDGTFVLDITTGKPQEVKIKTSEYTFKKLKFQVGLIDVNNDDVFNEPGVDKLLLLRSGNHSLYKIPKSQSGQLFEGSLFCVDKQYFKILSSTENGNELVFYPLNKRDRSVLIEPIAEINTILPNAELRDLNHKKVRIWNIKQKKKALLIQSWNGANEDGLETLKILDSLNHLHGDKFSIIGLTTSADARMVNRFFRKHNMDVQFYIAKYETIKKLGHIGLKPKGILYDKDGYFVKDGLGVDEIVEYWEGEGD